MPDVWPHVADALFNAGYRPDPATHREAVYGGWLTADPRPAVSPIPEFAIGRRVGTYETRLAAILDDAEVGHCDIQPDLTRGGMLPALRGWAWLTDLQVQETWRGRGIGTWLVQHAIAWLRLAGCDRVVLAVDDAADAVQRFYRRFGWDVLTRETHGWRAVSREG